MGKIADTFVVEFLAALPAGHAFDERQSTDRQIGEAIAVAFESALDRALGLPLEKSGLEEITVIPTPPARLDTWPAEGGPLDGRSITTDIVNESYFFDDVQPPMARHTYKRCKLLRGDGFVWLHETSEGMAG